MSAKRKNISVVLVIISVVILAYVLYHFDDPARFSELYIDTDGYEQIISARTQAADDLLDAVVFDDEELFLTPRRIPFITLCKRAIPIPVIPASNGGAKTI